jgi:putative nucleotidyltransferase with HDIG domain
MDAARESSACVRSEDATRKRILFVDDEVSILGGLRNVLRRYRNQWDMVFAISGEAALAEIEAAPFDVVVSDMRMPRMDGVALLERVKDRHPGITRIMLTGQMDSDGLPRALPVAHQFLAKPCDPEQLPRVIDRACSLASLVSEEELRRLASGIGRLPSLPQVYWELTEVLAKADSSVAELAHVVERDPIVAARVLQVVNSGYFALRRPVLSISEAVNLAGSEMLRLLVLSSTIFGASIEPGELAGLDYQHLQKHSVATSKVAGRIAPRAAATKAASAGLLHDLGKLVLAFGFPEGFATIGASLRRSNASFDRVEAQHLQLSHASVGGYLLGLWGLPGDVVDAVSHHHTPAAYDGDGTFGVVGAVHVADVLVTNGWPPSDPSPWFGSELDVAYVEAAGVADRLDEWQAIADEEIAACA